MIEDYFDLETFTDYKRAWIRHALLAHRSGNLERAAHCRKMAYRWYLRIIQHTTHIRED